MKDYWNHNPQNIIDTRHKNPFTPMSIMPMLDSAKERRTILRNLRSKDMVVGSFAFNRQVVYPLYQKRPFTDIDIKSKRPKQIAIRIEKSLDNMAGMNGYYVSKLKHDQGITYRVHNRATKKIVADVGSFAHPIPTRSLAGVMYETLAHRKKEINKLLTNPKASYRRDKDSRMMAIIDRYQTEVDTDLDGVPDYADCEPLNPKEQGPEHDNYTKSKKDLELAEEMISAGNHYMEIGQTDKGQRFIAEGNRLKERATDTLNESITIMNANASQKPPVQEAPFPAPKQEPEIHYPTVPDLEPIDTDNIYVRQSAFAREDRKLPSAGAPGSHVQRYSPVRADQCILHRPLVGNSVRVPFVRPTFITFRRRYRC